MTALAYDAPARAISPVERWYIDMIDIAACVIFTVEASIRIVALGFTAYRRDGWNSHCREFCYFADALSPSLLKHLLKAEGGCGGMTAAPTANRLERLRLRHRRRGLAGDRVQGRVRGRRRRGQPEARGGAADAAADPAAALTPVPPR